LCHRDYVFGALTVSATATLVSVAEVQLLLQLLLEQVRVQFVPKHL